MTILKFYQAPALRVVEVKSEQGFCVSISFGATIQGVAAPESFEMDEMTESTDNAAW